jgi:hypothetical protein
VLTSYYARERLLLPAFAIESNGVVVPLCISGGRNDRAFSSGVGAVNAD